MQALSKLFLFLDIRVLMIDRDGLWENGHNVLYIFQALPVKLELCYRKAWCALFTISVRLLPGLMERLKKDVDEASHGFHSKGSSPWDKRYWLLAYVVSSIRFPSIWGRYDIAVIIFRGSEPAGD
jgi:hypothetical protein